MVLLTGIAWGGLAFGAVYPWAYTPLLLCAGGSAAYMARQAPWCVRRNAGIAVGLAAFALACLVQLVPFGVGILARVSPNLPSLLASYVVGFSPAASGARHALTVSPRATLTALIFEVTFGSLLVTLAATLNRRAIATCIRGIAGIGTVMALVGIVQEPFFTGKIYGFWTPIARGNLEVFGPFVNRNHFAGWMLMALPLTLGYLASRVNRQSPSVRPGARARLVWLSSPEASEIVMLGAAALMMALSVAMTRSRSGLLGLSAVVLLTALWTARSSGGVHRMALGLFGVFILAFSVWWAGPDPTAVRFANFGPAFGQRAEFWRDAWHIGGRFLLTGTGLNTYGIATLFYQTTNLGEHAAQAHNDYLQVFAEGGLLLCIPAATIVGILVGQIRSRLRDDRPGGSMIWIRRGAITGLIAIALQEVADFSLQMPGNAFLFVVLTAVALASPDAVPPQAAAP